ncbi:MAG: sigma 54-interacting transcriptional regulator [Erysipelotrichia bacterium]|jgi:propionate catabolism operon transcriptional regulator|nr:sigma 54-interacting transcriptional regulator [Erysipelotrichia bacterium]
MEKVNGLVIAPYEGLKETFLSVAPDYASQINLDIYVGNLDEGLEIVKTIKNRYDIVISRGGTATLIRKSTDMFVMDIRISGYDFMRAFKMVENIHGKKALVGYENIIKGAHSVDVFMNTGVDLFTVTSNRQLSDLYKELQKQNYELIIGDTVACQEAEKNGISNLLLISGEESVKEAIESAIIVAQRIKRDNDRLYFLEMIHSRKSWTSVVFNSKKEVVMCYSKNDELSLPYDLLKEHLTSENHDLYLENDDGFYDLNYRALDDGYFLVQYRKVWNQNQRIRGVYVMNTSEKNTLKENWADRFFYSEKILALIDKASKSSRSVLLVGDTGAGKMEIAEFIHRSSSNKRYPFFSVDCSVVEYDDLSSFLDTIDGKKGTLCFSSLECLEDNEQRYLLKAIPQLNRNGLRIIGVANTRVNDYLANKQFDARLHRLFAELSFFVPNIETNDKNYINVINRLILKANENQGRQVTGIDNDAIKELISFDWIYNYDQLTSAVNQLVMMAKDTRIRLEDVKTLLQPLSTKEKYSISLDGTLEEIERRIIEVVIRQEGGNVTKAAERLQIGRSTIWRKMK